MRENKTETPVERAHVEQIERMRGRSLKFVVPAERGWPDRLDLLPVAPEHIDLVARYVRFTEVKAPGKKPDVRQRRRHIELRELGYIVTIVDKR